MYGPGTGDPPGFPELNADPHIVDAAVAQLEAFRRGAGREVGLLSTPTSTTRSTATSDWRARWSRSTSSGSRSTSTIRRASPSFAARPARRSRPANRFYGRRQFRPFFENQSVDYAIIDVAWNGILESVKIAAMADAFEVNVAPHNFNGHLGS